jgi:hypothetical protein
LCAWPGLRDTEFNPRTAVNKRTNSFNTFRDAWSAGLRHGAVSESIRATITACVATIVAT